MINFTASTAHCRAVGNEHADYKNVVLATPYNAECFTQTFSFPIPFLFYL